MSLEESLRRAARLATGDESVIDVAEMHPRGFAAATGIGAGAGSALGDGMTDSSFGSMIGGGGGAAAGMAAAAAARGLPLRVCVAVSPRRIHLLEIRNKLGYDDLAPFASLERAATEVKIHGRVFNRVVELKDTTTGRNYELEAPRLGPFQSKDLVSLLVDDGGNTEEVALRDEPA